jgi:hypothetical protein
MQLWSFQDPKARAATAAMPEEARVDASKWIHVATLALEPVVSDTSTVSRQVFESVEPVEVVDGYLCHGLGLSEAQVDGDAATSLLILLLSAPEGYAAAHKTEVEFNRVSPNVGLSLA